VKPRKSVGDRCECEVHVEAVRTGAHLDDGHAPGVGQVDGFVANEAGRMVELGEHGHRFAVSEVEDPGNEWVRIHAPAATLGGGATFDTNVP
jgi:hypothetical protein